MSDKQLIVGLGNPDNGYRFTRHNAGFMVIDKICGSTEWKLDRKFNALLANTTDYIYAKPLTYMNRSGLSVGLLKDYFKIENDSITIIHDELDLPFGEIRYKNGGGAAGHKGVISIINQIGPDFARIRLGIRNELANLIDADKFVLSNFSKEELEKLAELSQEIAKRFHKS